MRGIYTVSFTQQTFAAASGDYDFFELTPADDRPIELLALHIGNKSEIGDAQEEFIAYSIVTDNATSGNGTSATPTPLDPSDASATFTAETVASTPASTGTAITVVSGTFNVRAGLDIIYPEEMRPRVYQTDVMMCVRMLSTLTDDAVFSGTAWIRKC